MGACVTIGAMELTFLGGARTVTGSRHLVDTGRARVLIDCGMFQGGPADTMRNRVPLGFDPETLDAVVLTHAHLDHCGLLPLLVAQGFRGSIVCTAATAELARLVLLDSAKLQVEFAKRDARRDRRDPERAAADDEKAHDVFDDLVQLAAEGALAPGGPDPEELLRAAGPEVIVELDGPLYTEDEVDLTLSLFRPIPYDQSYEAAQGVHVTLLDAGHILGSALVRMQLTRPDGGRDTVILFSGDLGRPGTPILRDPTAVSEADFVVCESTYGGREHQAAEVAIDMLADVVNDVVRKKGVLLIPSFAIGRTQDIVWELDRLLSAGRIPQLPLFLDSPMARGASDIYRAHPEAYDEETAALLAAHEAPLDFPGQQVVQNVEESHRIARAAAAVHHRRVERDAHRRAVRRAMPSTCWATRRRRCCSSATRARARSAAISCAARTARASRATRSRSARRSARSTGSPPTRTSPSSSTGSATSSADGDRAMPACRATCSSSTATRRPRPRSCPRSRGSGSGRPSPPGSRRCRSTSRRVRPRARDTRAGGGSADARSARRGRGGPGAWPRSAGRHGRRRGRR